MEIKGQLLKPYTEVERLDFICEFQYGYEIRETAEALEAWGYTAEEEQEQAEQAEQERKSKLKMTKRDFFLYVVYPFGVSYADLINALKSNDLVYACYEGCNHIYRYDGMLIGNIKPMLESLTGQTIDETQLMTMLDAVFEEHNAIE